MDPPTFTNPDDASPDGPPRPKRCAPLVVGILGGIASGKSAVAAALARDGGVAIDADAIAREVLASPALVERLRSAFGADVIGADGTPDRARLAARVFADPAARARLEGWTHPAVRARILADLAQARASGAPRIVLDVPLLLENDAQHGLASLCDVLVFVDADDAERDRRAVQNRGWEPGEVRRREAAQLPLAHKRERADFVIHNDGSPQQLDAAVRRILTELERRRPRV